jgi:hypothetical protein
MQHRLSNLQFCIFLAAFMVFVVCSFRLVVGACLSAPFFFRVENLVGVIASVLTFTWLSRHAIAYRRDPSISIWSRFRLKWWVAK